MRIKEKQVEQKIEKGELNEEDRKRERKTVLVIHCYSVLTTNLSDQSS